MEVPEELAEPPSPTPPAAFPSATPSRNHPLRQHPLGFAQQLLGDDEAEEGAGEAEEGAELPHLPAALASLNVSGLFGFFSHVHSSLLGKASFQFSSR